MKETIVKKFNILPIVLFAIGLVAGCGKGDSNDNTTPPPKDNGAGAGEGGGGSVPLSPHQRAETPAAKASPQKSSMAEVAKHLDFGGSAFSYQSNEGMGTMMEGMLSFIETMLKAEGDPKALAVLKVLRSAYEESGLNDISGTGSSSFITENGIRRNAMMAHHWPGQDKGLLWKLLGGPAHELDGLKLMPANTALAMHGDLDVAAGWAWIKAFMAKQDPAMAREFNAMLSQMANNNVPVEELLQSLGGEAGVSVLLHPTKTVEFPNGGKWEVDAKGNDRFVQETITIPEPGFVLAVKVKNTLLMQMLGGMLQAQGAEETSIDGVKAFTLMPPPGEEIPFPLSPTLLKLSDYLVLASTKELAGELASIQSGKSKGLAGTAEFQKVTAGMELKGNHLFYLSPAVKTMGLKLVEEALAGEREFRDPNARAAMMQLIGMFANYVSHQVILVKRLPDGLLVDNRATGGGLMAGGGGGAGTVATVGVLASMLLPALAKAKAKANAIKSVNNAASLGKALLGYSQDNGNKLPAGARWCDDILREAQTRKIYVSPQDPSASVRAEAGQDFSSYALNAAVAGKGYFDLAPDTVLVFECPLGWNGSGGAADIHGMRARNPLYGSLQTIAVVLADGSARQVRFTESNGLNWTGQKRR